MPSQHEKHRPVIGGIMIGVAFTRADNMLLQIDKGTLTGLAAKGSQKVFVINRHVILRRTHPDELEKTPDYSSNGQRIYQSDYPNPHTDLEAAQQFRSPATDRISDSMVALGIVDPAIDAAACPIAVQYGRDALFAVHGPNHETRGPKTVTAGTREPAVDMNVSFVGMMTGWYDTQVNARNISDTFPPYYNFSGCFTLDMGDHTPLPGDSGGPVLFHDTSADTYHMVGMCVGRKLRDDGRWELFCNTASDVESALLLEFGNHPPIADAGLDQPVATGATVTLDGSGSGDPDGDALTYLWEQSPGAGGSNVTLSDPAAMSPTFMAPAGPAALAFKLTVTDSYGATAADTVSVTVLEAGVESLGDFSGTVPRNGSWTSAVASVNRSDSYAKFYAFSLEQRARVRIELASSVDTYLYLISGAAKSGTVLERDDDDGSGLNSRIERELEAGIYLVEATTYWPRRTGNFTVAVDAPGSNRVPVANAGPLQEVATGVLVTLDGSGSRDLDGDVLTYLWEQLPGVGGSDVTLSDAAAVSPTFRAPAAPAALSFQLTVTDSHGAVGTSEVAITIQASPPPPPPPPFQSSDASLRTLEIDPASVTLDPPFTGSTTEYTASVGNAVASMRVTPEISQADATVTVNGAAVTSGQQSQPITLTEDMVTTITVVVTAQNGTT